MVGAEPLAASVELAGVAVRRGRRIVLTGCDAQVGVGITAVVGRNGSGKTSLVRTIATVEPPAVGRLLVGGYPVHQHGPRQRARSLLGYVPQEWSLPPAARVADVLHHAAWLHRVDDPDRAVAAVVERLDLAAVRRARLGQLSTGVRRRVAVASGLVHEPAIAVLDEPTAGLDPDQRELLWMVLEERARRGAVIVVLHDRAEVELHAQKVIVVEDGSLHWGAEHRP
jgi:ABC-2 type transport system ATP-binding protein